MADEQGSHAIPSEVAKRYEAALGMPNPTGDTVSEKSLDPYSKDNRFPIPNQPPISSDRDEKVMEEIWKLESEKLERDKKITMVQDHIIALAATIAKYQLLIIQGEKHIIIKDEPERLSVLMGKATKELAFYKRKLQSLQQQ